MLGDFLRMNLEDLFDKDFNNAAYNAEQLLEGYTVALLAKEVIIETESRTEKEILVTAGLKPGDTVIISGIMALKEGAPLNVTLPKN